MGLEEQCNPCLTISQVPKSLMTESPSRPVSLLSVVMPNRNHAHHIEAALRAHLAQTTPPREILVIDDASTDDSVHLVSRLARTHPTIKLIRRLRNGGPNAAINDGLSAATGEFVSISASDDLVSPIFAEKTLRALSENPDAALAFSDSSEIFDQIDRQQVISLALSDSPRFFDPKSFESLMRVNYFTISANTVIYRREQLLAIGGYRTDLEWQADWFANLVLAFRHGACYVPGALAHFRVVKRSYSATGTSDRAGQRRLLYHALDILRTEYADVSPRFRNAALIPEMRIRDLYWLLTSSHHRRFVTPALCRRVFAREVWSHIRPFTPVTTRQYLRKRLGNRT